ncbi:fasciclin domain-containing protein [Streptomyces sp. NRRL B-24484]|uniref:fasciclin domain-containing protein n=1 Tax=Streptomyces sp. NRRL B-24484 TaxID=1463833 RepID=UPI0004BEA1CA|nr:fasciclin domain-containing protein [Streptomyces sp. NRRL B-24484]
MSRLSAPRSFAVLLAVGSLALGLGGCSSSGSDYSAGADSAATAMQSPDGQVPAAQAAPAGGAQPFGAACASVPSQGAGSFAGMAQDPVATAASNNPALSTLVAAVTKAGLVDTLNSAQNITVFAPTNDAFAKIPKADLDAVLADKAKLTKILTYHVVPERLAPAALPGEHKTLEGGKVRATGSGEDFTVNGKAKVVCGNVRTANATVHIVDTVLMPTS